VIEHSRRGAQWSLAAPSKADETTDALYRFKGALESGKARKLNVTEQWVRGEVVAILPMELAQLRAYALNSPLPQKVKDALGQAAELRRVVAETERQIQERQQKIAQVSQEQARIRENMKTVAPKSDYSNRLLKKLDEQETQIETFQKEVEALQKQRDQQRKALEDYVANLNVE
jgi:septal ring factor EnvC (AmiA/AmiB activator)